MGTDSDNTERATSPTSVAPLEAGSEGKTTEPIGPPVIPPPLRAPLARFLRSRKHHRPTDTAKFLAAWPYIMQLRELLPISAKSREIDSMLSLTPHPADLANVIRLAYIATFGTDGRLDSDHRRELGPRQSPPYVAAAGTPGFLGIDYFRSDWEARLSKALTRLGINWTYEPEWFGWRDNRGTQHRYTPDFRLDDLALTFIEVKGINGPDEQDSWKMARVLANYPNMTLLLWDASVVEFIEDMAQPSQVLGLLRTTKLAA